MSDAIANAAAAFKYTAIEEASSNNGVDFLSVAGLQKLSVESSLLLELSSVRLLIELSTVELLGHLSS